MRKAAVIALVSCVVLLPRSALAYRPFDGTDAGVATEGDLEIELGPIGYLKEPDERLLVAPAVVLNLGFMHDWELVLSGRGFIPIDTMPGVSSRSELGDTSLVLKTVLREGCLQDKTGLSIATEFGAVLPTIGGESGAGASGAVIVSQSWKALTIHVNGEVALVRDHHLDLFGGVILEGPRAWPVRPVAEVFVEREFNDLRVLSGLAGAIWQVSDALSFDAALRVGSLNGGGELEVRAGVTWALSLWEPIPRAQASAL
jgi:hypothetical protein